MDTLSNPLTLEQGQIIEQLKIYQRAANYLAAAQIYLQDNFLLERRLQADDIKPRLLGHWGTCPGINLIYSHLNRLILENKLDMFLVTGPGHGAPANLANLFLEGSLEEFYPQLTRDFAGLSNLIKGFSWPGGFPSHLYPGVPGTIHEGGELGYALATAFGAIMDNPNLIVACIVGDGEAETGPTATAWHSYKFIDPAESGAVLPIVHLNGYKISSPTIYGTMSDEELTFLFKGYGYHPIIVSMPDIENGLYNALDLSYREILKIQAGARSGNPIPQPKWPVILLRSPKGWTGIKEADGLKIEGFWRSHQVPLKDVKTNPASLKLLEDWLQSYKPQELFDKKGKPIDEILNACPKGKARMGMNPHTYGGEIRVPLAPQNIYHYQTRIEERGEAAFSRGKQKISNAKTAAKYLTDVIRDNPHTFRIFSPDELESNQLNVFEATHRDYQWPLHSYDTSIGSRDGRVLEILSEHTCQGWMQGYVLTGRTGLFPSYEAFLGIITTMMDQYAKFIKTSLEIPWRKPVSSLTYIATSTHWRQEHNGFSHQNPGLINSLLNKKGETARIYLPPDANSLISTLDHCLRSKNYVNLIVTSKHEMPQWLSMDEAVANCRAGASIWKWASIDDGVDPDVVLVGIGDDLTNEIMAAADILRNHMPALRVRVVNVTDLLCLENYSKHPHGLTDDMFNALFTADKPVIFNFHGYTTALAQLLFNRGDTSRYFIHGYQEEGTTTTAFDMMIRNHTSRFDIAIEAITLGSRHNAKVAVSAAEKISYFQYRLKDHRSYILKYGQDPEDITNWVWGDGEKVNREKT